MEGWNNFVEFYLSQQIQARTILKNPQKKTNLYWKYGDYTPCKMHA